MTLMTHLWHTGRDTCAETTSRQQENSAAASTGVWRHLLDDCGIAPQLINTALHFIAIFFFVRGTEALGTETNFFPFANIYQQDAFETRFTQADFIKSRKKDRNRPQNLIKNYFSFLFPYFLC